MSEGYANGVRFATAYAARYGFNAVVTQIRNLRAVPERAEYVAGMCDVALSLVLADRRLGVTRS